MGISVTKIILLIVVIGAVIFGARLLRTLGSPRPKAPDQPEGTTRSGEAATFEACPRCGAYVDPAQHRCGPDGDKSAA